MASTTTSKCRCASVDAGWCTAAGSLIAVGADVRVPLLEVSEQTVISVQVGAAVEHWVEQFQQRGMQFGHGTARYFAFGLIERALAMRLINGVAKVDATFKDCAFMTHQARIGFLARFSQVVDAVRSVWHLSALVQVAVRWLSLCSHAGTSASCHYGWGGTLASADAWRCNGCD